MANTLTQLIAKVQAQLLDGGTLFTAATSLRSERGHPIDQRQNSNAAAR